MVNDLVSASIVLDEEFETGECTYTIYWQIITHTSGTELLGPEFLLDECTSRLAAEIVLANDSRNFTRKMYNRWQSQNGCTSAYIKRVVKYDFE